MAVSDCLNVGLSYTSPRWYETWRFNARDEVGNPLSFRKQLTLPQIFSTGVFYTGIENLVLSADVRWFDHATTKLLGESASLRGGRLEKHLGCGARAELIHSPSNSRFNLVISTMKTPFRTIVPSSTPCSPE